MSDLYDTDFHEWAETQAAALRNRSANALDWDNIAEEIESLARRDRREIRNRLEVLCQHLLKWEFASAVEHLAQFRQGGAQVDRRSGRGKPNPSSLSGRQTGRRLWTRPRRR